MNPYFGSEGVGFLYVFVKRMFQWVTGQLGAGDLASDELQFAVLALIAISCSLVGAFLVLKKMTMMANSLSHTILPGLVVAFLFCGFFSEAGPCSFVSMSAPILLFASLVTALITTFSTQFFHRLFKLQEDASIGLVSTTMVAIGVVLVTVYTRSTHLGVEAVMGNVDALHPHDLKNAGWIALLNFVVISSVFKELELVVFDVGFSRTQGFSEKGFNYLLMLLTSLTVIGAFRAVGILLVLSFLVGPVLFARQWTHSLKSLIIVAIGTGVVASFLSVWVSRHCLSAYQMPLSTSGIASTLLGLIYFCSLGIKLTLQKLDRTGTLRGISIKGS